MIFIHRPHPLFVKDGNAGRLQYWQRRGQAWAPPRCWGRRGGGPGAGRDGQFEITTTVGGIDGLDTLRQMKSQRHHHT
jgi:hypothetical protein